MRFEQQTWDVTNTGLDLLGPIMISNWLGTRLLSRESIGEPNGSGTYWPRLLASCDSRWNDPRSLSQVPSGMGYATGVSWNCLGDMDFYPADRRFEIFFWPGTKQNILKPGVTICRFYPTRWRMRSQGGALNAMAPDFAVHENIYMGLSENDG